MARITKRAVIDAIENFGMVLVFYLAELEKAKAVIAAYYKGGGRIAEFTNRGPGAFLVFAELYKWCAATYPDLVLGVGSIITPGMADTYINLGARFVVGPVFKPATAETCNSYGVLYCPGCGSATEISTAQAAGCDLVKVFPGDAVGGWKFAKAVRGPMPWTEEMITGGVKAEPGSIGDWFSPDKGGVEAVGIGGDIVSSGLVKQEGFEAVIEQRTAQTLAWIRTAREGK